MSTLFDSHVHFTEDNGETLVDQSIKAGVTRLVAVGGCPATNASAMAMARRAPDHIRMALGFDRSQTTLEQPGEQLRELHRQTQSGPSLAAIGEIGLDFYYSPETATQQQNLMAQMLALAAEWTLPVIVHTRAADQPTLDLLREHVRNWRGDANRIGVLHCFTGNRPFAEAVLDLGFYISFSGIITFRNADDLREVARHIPDQRLLIETDTPYLTPVPCRGKPNEPAMLVHIARLLGKIRGWPPEEIARITTANANRLFHWQE